MVDSISDSIYSQSVAGAYSIGTYSQVNKTDTEVFETAFQDTLDALGDKTQEQSVAKIDESTLGIPAGMEIEGAQDTQSVAQSEESSSSGSGGSSSDSEDEEEYNEMDLNQDGTVSAAEMIIYEMRQGMSSDGTDSATVSDALSAYSAA